MRNIAITSIIGLFLANASADERSEWLEERQRWIQQAKNHQDVDALVHLARIIRGVGSNLKGATPEALTLYNQAQSAILDFEGHATLFGNLIEDERGKVAHLPANTGPRVSYDFNRQIVFETLVHIPSPETVKVLGEYLSDERDLHEMTPEETAGQSCLSGGSTGNSTYATKALEKSALRSKPYRPGSVLENDVAKAAWRKWWGGIEAGRETFSFSGQNVEYRFKPDGTWETLSLGKVTKTELDYGTTTETRTERRPHLPPVQETPPGFHIHRLWVLFLVGLAGISGLWWALRKKT
jgi:hypothetical protein